ncbi:MAG: AsmA family protein [Betaproteobacteria bacterium]
MPKTLRRLLFALAGAAGVLLLMALAVRLFFDINAYKPRVEAAASRSLGMVVTVEGPLGIGFTPALQVTLENVRVHHRGTEIAFVKAIDLTIPILPLLRQEIRYDDIATRGARISIVRSREGRYNYERTDGVPAAFHALDLKSVSFADLIVAFSDQITGGGFESTGCRGGLKDMRHPGDAPFLRRLSLSGEFACREVRGKNSTVSDLTFSVAATDGVFDFKPVTLRAFGGDGSATLRIDRSAEIPTFEVHYALSKLHIEEFFKPQASGKSVSGQMNFSTTLTLRGKTRVDMKQSAQGEMSLSGQNLVLGGVDLDKQLPKYESSQNFNLLDVGALLFAGPIGLAVTKGVELTSLAQPAGGSTQIRTLVSVWKVEKGVAYAQDVALATPQQRLALHGGLDFVGNKYQDVTVALVDSNGCARVRQKIAGPFNQPAAEKSAILVSVGPVMNLVDKARKLFSGGDSKCEVFYRGSVAAPK